jgi:hypothetical protein
MRDHTLRGAVERYIEVALECMIDIGEMIISKEKLNDLIRTGTFSCYLVSMVSCLMILLKIWHQQPGSGMYWYICIRK